MAMNQAALIQRIRWHLGDIPWETTGGANDETTATIDIEEATEWNKGDVGEFVDNGDTFYVRDSIPSSAALLVTRNYLGSEATSHASGTRIFKNPKYRHAEIQNAISEIIEFRLPWPRFYQVKTVAIIPDPETTEWYNVDDSLALISASQIVDTFKHRSYNTRHAYDRVEFSNQLDPNICLSGCGVRFLDPFKATDTNVQVRVAALITDDIFSGDYTDFDLGDPITTAIEYGAVSLLQGALELRKPRKSAEETDYLRAASVFDNLHQRALRTAEKKLRQLFPLAKGWDK